MSNESNISLKVWLWELTPQGQDNVKHTSYTKDSPVSMVSVPIEDNDLDLNADPHPQILDTLKSKLEFKGSIRLSESGKSWNIFRTLPEDMQSDLVQVNLGASPF